jgi:hypothetical protein
VALGGTPDTAGHGWCWIFLEPEEWRDLYAQALEEFHPEVPWPDSPCRCSQNLVDVGSVAVLRNYPGVDVGGQVSGFPCAVQYGCCECDPAALGDALGPRPGSFRSGRSHPVMSYPDL